MAGDWLPMRVDLTEDPAVIAIATATGLDEYAVVGRLHKLWSWANKHLATGLAQGLSEDWVDRYVSAPGFASAMLAAGWLRTRSGNVTEFPHFDRWNSGGAKKRLLNAQWMRNNRARGAECGDSNTTQTPPEKRREEKSKKVPSEPVAAPAAQPKPKPKREPKPRERNPLFDAIADVCGVDPATAGSLIGAVASSLSKADPPYTPGDVTAFAERFWELCPWAAQDGRQRPTPKELQTHIGKLRAAPAPVQSKPVRQPNLFSLDHGGRRESRVLAQVAEALSQPPE